MRNFLDFLNFYGIFFQHFFDTGALYFVLGIFRLIAARTAKKWMGKYNKDWKDN